jgi:hypothetical protein
MVEAVIDTVQNLSIVLVHNLPISFKIGIKFLNFGYNSFGFLSVLKVQFVQSIQKAGSIGELVLNLSEKTKVIVKLQANMLLQPITKLRIKCFSRDHLTG